MSDAKRFHRDMTIGEAMATHERASEVFMSFHLGGCSHCGISTEETISQVCAGYGIPEEMLLDALNGLFAEASQAPSPGAPAPGAH